MKIGESRSEVAVVLELGGKLDANTSGALEKKFQELLDEGNKNYILDLSPLEYISSAGLRVLLMATKKSKGMGGKIVLSGLREHVQEVFDIAGFTAIFPICATREEAVRLF